MQNQQRCAADNDCVARRNDQKEMSGMGDKVIEIDGRTGEGGGQLVRIAVALAAAASKAVRITNVRGNRPGARGGGLKSQHVTSIEWLAKTTRAEVTGLEIGSHSLEFRPTLRPGDMVERDITIRAESPAASAMLVFQAVFPFMLFAANRDNELIELVISGGTNVSFSLSYEYLDQVLLPTLEDWYGIRVERQLRARGWSSGRSTRGEVSFKIQPLPFGTSLHIKDDLRLGKDARDFVVKTVDSTVIAPSDLHAELETALRKYLGDMFPDVETKLRDVEESKHESRIYVLLVAKSDSLRWARDNLYSKKRKGKSNKELCHEIAREVVEELCDEIQRGGIVDEHLQDQLVVFQALAKGRSSYPRTSIFGGAGQTQSDLKDNLEEALEGLCVGDRMRHDVVDGPLGDPRDDSTHTTTARWVTAEMLGPDIKWFNKGTICEGVGLVSGKSSKIT